MVSMLCQNVPGDGASAARVDAAGRNDRGKATSDAGQLTWTSMILL